MTNTDATATTAGPVGVMPALYRTPDGAPATRLTDVLHTNVYSSSGSPASNGPRCLTCGSLAVVGDHARCERGDASLLYTTEGGPVAEPSLLVSGDWRHPGEPCRTVNHFTARTARERDPANAPDERVARTR